MINGECKIFSDSAFTIKNVFFRINNADNRAVGRCRIAFEWKTRFFAAAPENQFANARANRIKRDQRLSHRLQIGVQSLDDQQFSRLKRFVFDRRNDVSDDAGKLHFLSFVKIKN